MHLLLSLVILAAQPAKDAKQELVGVLTADNGQWSGTMTIDDKDVKVTRLTVTTKPHCRSCKVVPSLTFAFKFADSYALPTPERQLGGFMFPLPFGRDSVYVTLALHGDFQLLPGAELVLEEARSDEKGGDKRCDGKLTYYPDNRNRVGTSSAALSMSFPNPDLVRGTVSGKGIPNAKFEFTRSRE